VHSVQERQDKCSERHKGKHEQNRDAEQDHAIPSSPLEIANEHFVVGQSGHSGGSGKFRNNRVLNEAAYVPDIGVLVDIHHPQYRRQNREHEQYARIPMLGEVEAGDDADCCDVD